MSSIFSDLTGSIDQVLGPGYDYAARIPAPSAMGVSSDGTIDATMGDISALAGYAGYLVTGPNLGNKYFMNTGAQCTAPSGASVDRWHYIDNSNDQPMASGSLAAFASGELQGMIPGLIAAVGDLNPMNLLGALVRPGNAACQQVTCPTGDVTGTMTTDTQYVLQDDVPGLTANYGCSVKEGFASRPPAARAPAPLLPIAAILLVTLLVMRAR